MSLRNTVRKSVADYSVILIGLIAVLGLGVLAVVSSGGITGSTVSSACYDSDSLEDYYVKGYAKYRTKTQEDYCSDDGVKLYQYYCKSSIKISKIHSYPCPNGCKDGACIREKVVCGNAKVESGEQCDDGNANNGDGCDRNCVPEGGYQCHTTSVCNYGS